MSIGRIIYAIIGWLIIVIGGTVGVCIGWFYFAAIKIFNSTPTGDEIMAIVASIYAIGPAWMFGVGYCVETLEEYIWRNKK